MGNNFTVPTNVGGAAYATTINAILNVFDGEKINVKSPLIGAVGDGATDDTAALQLASDALETLGGGKLYFPPGLYMTDGLTAGFNGRVQGAGADVSRLKLRNNANAPVIDLDAEVTSLVFSHLGIDGNKANNATPGPSGNIGITTAGAFPDQPRGVVIKHCRIVDCYSLGIHIYGSECKVLHNTVKDCTGIAVRIESAGTGGSYQSCDNNLVEGNRIDNCASGVYIAGGTDADAGMEGNVVSKNYITSMTNTIDSIGHDGGVAIHHSRFSKVLDNRITDNYGRGIHVWGYCRGSVVRGNTIEDCGVANHTSGLDLGDVGDYDYVVEGNVARGCGGSGVITAPLAHSIIGHNVCANNGQTPGNTETSNGISLIGVVSPAIPQTRIVVIGNRCYDDQGTKTQQYGIREWPSDASSDPQHHSYGIYIGNNVGNNLVGGILLVSNTSTNANNLS